MLLLSIIGSYLIWCYFFGVEWITFQALVHIFILVYGKVEVYMRAQGFFYMLINVVSGNEGLGIFLWTSKTYSDNYYVNHISK